MVGKMYVFNNSLYVNQTNIMTLGVMKREKVKYLNLTS